LILISKQESQLVRARYPQAEIVRTCIQKSKRHKYYLPENDKYLRLIRRTNNQAAMILEERHNKMSKTNNYKNNIER
jgi:hypothetical protein